MNIQIGIARSPNVTQEFYPSLANSQDPRVVIEFIRNPQITNKNFEALSQHPDIFVRYEVFCNRKTPSPIFRKLREEFEAVSDLTILRKFARNFRTSKRMFLHIEKISQLCDFEIALALAENHKTPVEIFKQLVQKYSNFSKATDLYIAITLAKNKKVTGDVLGDIAALAFEWFNKKLDESEMDWSSLKEFNPGIDCSLITLSNLFYELAKHENTPQEILQRFLNNPLYITVYEGLSQNISLKDDELFFIVEEVYRHIEMYENSAGKIFANICANPSAFARTHLYIAEKECVFTTVSAGIWRKRWDTIFEAMVQHPNAPESILKFCIRENVVRVNHHELLTHTNITRTINKKYMEMLITQYNSDPTPNLRYALVGTSSQLLKILFRRFQDNDELKLALAQNTCTPSQILFKLAHDKNPEIACFALANPNFKGDFGEFIA